MNNIPTDQEALKKEVSEYCGILISPNWDCVKPFQWMCENARFIFSHKSYGGERIKVVVNEPIEKCDCFEIGNDRFGIVVKADTTFNNGWGSMIEDSSKDIVGYVREYLVRQGATDLIKNINNE